MINLLTIKINKLVNKHHGKLFKHSLFGTSSLKSSTTSQHKYLKLIENLKDREYVLTLLREQERLRKLNQGGIVQSKHLQNKVNDLLQIWRLLTWAQAYQPSMKIPTITHQMTKIQEMMETIFSQEMNNSYQQYEEEHHISSKPLSFNLYFELASKISPTISSIYFNSYLNITRERWPLELLKASEALKEKQNGQTQSYILDSTRIHLSEIVQRIWKKYQPGNPLLESQMALYLGHYKNRIDQLGEQESRQVKDVVLCYIQNDINQNSFLHLQNMLYCLYLGIFNLDLKQQIIFWIMEKFNERGEQGSTAIFLSTLYEHQDKLSCLKIDLWMGISSSYSQHKNKNDVFVAKNASIHTHLLDFNFSTWRYKYIVWLLDSLISHSPTTTLPSNIIKTVVKHTLNKQNLLSSFIHPFIIHTLEEGFTPNVVQMEQKVAKWLYGQTDESLLTQTPQALCSILPHADRHPALHLLYLPYLQRLLVLSLGRFEWTILNQLYYFGLRWKQNESDEGYWRMQYVRRYIMNEYMGIRRRQIPENSYFYRIHQETTPDEFYKNQFKQ